MLNYKYIGNLNDYIIENLYHEPINQLKRIEKENNVTDSVAYNTFILDLLEFKRESKENKVRSEPIKKTRHLSHPRTPSDMSIDEERTERHITPFLNRAIANNNEINPNTPKAPKKREREEKEPKYSRPLKRQLFGQKGGEHGKKYKEYIDNLYLYDNYHDFHGNSRGDKALPSELLLLNSKKINNNLSKTEKIFFIKALCDLNDENPLLFTKYYFIKNSNSKLIFSNKGKKIEDIKNDNFKVYLDNNLNFVKNKTVYDGKVTNLSPDLKKIRDVIEEYKQEITAEIIFDPMNTKLEHYNEMNTKLSDSEYLIKLSKLSNSVFNTGNDSISAFNNKTRDFFNIVYYKKNKKNNYSIALLFINNQRNLYKNIKEYKNLDFLKYIKKDNSSGNYIEQEYKNIDNETFIALDIVYLHMFSKDNEEINSVKNIKDMIHIIYHNKIKELKKDSFKYYLVNYIYQNDEEKTNAIDILFDLKKAGDYGKVLLCHYNNNYYDDKFLLSTNDTLCALNGILRKNINVVFGTTDENSVKNLCFYSCCNDNYNILHLKNILEATFKENIYIDKDDINKEVNTPENANIINKYIQELKNLIIEKYKKDFIKTLLPKGRNKNTAIIGKEETKINSLLSKLDKTIENFIKKINNIKSINGENYIKEHKLIFNKYINNISDLLTIYEYLIINKANIISTLKKYFTLLNNPIKQLKILIPRENDRANINRFLSTLENYLKQKDKDVYFRSNAICNYYLIKSRDTTRYINHLTLLLNIFINKVINNTESDNEFNNIIYELYYEDINNIYDNIFVNEKSNYNNETLKKYLIVIIKTFREYLLQKYNINNKPENKSILLKILDSLEYFESDFNNIIENIRNIRNVINNNINRKRSPSRSPISRKQKKQKEISPEIPSYLMYPPNLLPKQPYSLMNPPVGKIPDIRKPKASLPSQFNIIKPPRASLPKRPYSIISPPKGISSKIKKPSVMLPSQFNIINPPKGISSKIKKPSVMLPKRPYSIISPPKDISSKVKKPSVMLPKRPYSIISPPKGISSKIKKPSDVLPSQFNIISPPKGISSKVKKPSDVLPSQFNIINPPKGISSKVKKPSDVLPSQFNIISPPKDEQDILSQ